MILEALLDTHDAPIILVGGLVFFGSQLTEILDDVLHVGQEGANGLVPARIEAERDKLVLELGAFCFSDDSIGELLNEVSMKALRITVGFSCWNTCAK